MNRKQEQRSATIEGIKIERGEANRPTKFTGHAAVFGVVSTVLMDCEGNDFREILDPGCFAESLAVDDIYAFKNHNEDEVLGRNRSGTLRLWEDERALGFSDDIPNTSYALDLAESMDRGDLDQCSFGFDSLEESIDEGADGIPIRRIHKAKLWEISLGVPYPAYELTYCSVRSIRARDGAPIEPKAIEVRAVRPRLDRAKRYLNTL